MAVGRSMECSVSNTGVILFSFYPNTLTMHHAYPRFHFYYHTKQWDGYGKREEGPQEYEEPQSSHLQRFKRDESWKWKRIEVSATGVHFLHFYNSNTLNHSPFPPFPFYFYYLAKRKKEAGGYKNEGEGAR